jgi:LCP family protein required for cell wall assembly
MNDHESPPLSWWKHWCGRGRWPFAILDLLLVSVLGLYFFTDARLDRIDVVASRHPYKPPSGVGQDWLLVGHDSLQRPGGGRHGTSPTVSARGPRVDMIMLLHIPHDGGRPTLVSLPLDSYVVVLGYRANALSAAFTLGGRRLLVNTVENATGISVERYLEFGFDELAAMVDAVEGIRICADEPVRGLKRPQRDSARCHDLTGGQALGYLRIPGTLRGRLDSIERQRQVVMALLEKATSPGLLLNPVRGIRLAVEVADAITLDEGDHLHHLIRFVLALRGDGGVVKATVPIMRIGAMPGVGPVVIWDAVKMRELARALAADRPAPKDLIRE